MDRFVGDKPYLEITKGLKMQFLIHLEVKNQNLLLSMQRLMRKKNLMEAKNTVKVKNIEGDMLETEHLIWNEKTEMVFTEDFVKITTKDEVIYGEGLSQIKISPNTLLKKLGEP